MKKSLIIMLLVIILLLVGWVIYALYQSKQKQAAISEVIEMMNFEKEQTEREFQNVVTEFDDYNVTTIKNDSLFKLLDDQKQKIQQLLDELRVTKATNAKRISELKAELAT
ncbi:MAG: hypothetical protein LBV75_02220, partial [Paludibacter sp.]|nr:hypothetical protein [Paludibacter sp.]